MAARLPGLKLPGAGGEDRTPPALKSETRKDPARNQLAEQFITPPERLACSVRWRTLRDSHGGGNDGSDQDDDTGSEGGTNAQAPCDRRQGSGNAQAPGDRRKGGSDKEAE